MPCIILPLLFPPSRHLPHAAGIEDRKSRQGRIILTLPDNERYNRFMKRMPVIAIFGLLVAATGLLRADNQFVNWDFGFSPATVTITAGDSITWVDTDFSGTTISVSSDGPGFF